MKINVRVIFDKREVMYEIPVGMGDKTFKWLGMVACNRFSSSCPGGALRRRDPVRRGINPEATHQPVEMALPDGQIPHPHALIYDFLADGEEVKVHLVDSQELSREDGTPTYTKWSKIAFNSKINNNDDNGNEDEEENLGSSTRASAFNDIGNNGDIEQGESEHVYTQQQKNGRAQFMRLLFKSQMVNTRAVEESVRSTWTIVKKAMPKLDKGIENELIQVYCDNWETFTELFHYFTKITNGPNGRLPKEGFYRLLSEAKVFPNDILTNLYVRIYDRALTSTDRNESCLSLGGLMVAMILIAQTKYNDTYTVDDESYSYNSIGAGPALKDILENYFLIVSERCEMISMLKNVFMSTDNLNQLREWHDELFACFNKYASRTKELPSSINYKDFTEMLYDASLTEAAEVDQKGNVISHEYDTAAALLESVRQGLIHGRPIVSGSGSGSSGSSSEEKQGGEETTTNSNSKSNLPDDVIPDDEFTYPEMVEAICRHAFNRFRGTKPDPDTGIVDYMDYIGDLSVMDCFVKGLVLTLQVLTVNAKP
jgi:hypothetical protein